MATRIPTQIGDVLILGTDKTFSTYAVGQISKDGQQDFRGQTHVKYVSGHPAAVAEAKALVAPARRIFFRNIDDMGDWSEISHGGLRRIAEPAMSANDSSPDARGRGAAMVRLGNATLRRLALKVLAQRAGPSANAETLAAAAHRAYDDLARVSAPLIGQVGVDALTGRALHLAQREYPWLARTREPEQAEGPFVQVILCLERQDPRVATEAAGAVFATLTGLLVTFIGEPLTARLLRKAWPDVFADANTGEI